MSRLICGSSEPTSMMRPLRFLALDDVFHGPFQSLAVWAIAGCMTVSHERKHAQAGHAGLGIWQRRKGAVRLLLRGQEGEAAIDRLVNAAPFLGR